MPKIDDKNMPVLAAQIRRLMCKAGVKNVYFANLPRTPLTADFNPTGLFTASRDLVAQQQRAATVTFF
jgi:hypothetical protein